MQINLIITIKNIMGMYDSIYMKNIECPGCGVINGEDMEGQTKDLDNCLENLFVDAYVGNQYRFINVCAKCCYCDLFFAYKVYIDENGYLTSIYKIT